ncbi:MAG: GAF domain-containing protein [Gaiellales bacterium]|nr:MAG: GAF domain-containing protein [Gaiellales bacterium]
MVPRIGLRGKLLLLVIPGVIIISGMLTFLGSWYISRAFNNEYIRLGEVITGFVSRELRHHDPALADDPIEFASVMQGVVDSVMETNPEVDKLSIYGPSGGDMVVIASSEPELLGRPADEEDIRPMTTGSNEIVDSLSHEESDGTGSGLSKGQIEMLAPISNASGIPVASLGLYMDTGPRDSLIHAQQVRFAIVANLLLLSVVLALYLLLNFNIVKPIHGLVAAMRGISDSPGRLDLPQPWLSRKDEVGGLARAFEDLQTSLGEREDEVRLLLDASVAVSSALHVDRIMQILCDKIAQTKMVTYCRISLLDDSRNVLAIQASYPTRKISDWKSGIGERLELDNAPFHAEVIASGRPLVVRDGQPSDDERRGEWEWMLTPETQSALFLPLIAKDDVVGVVTLGEERRWDRTPFTEAKVSFYQTLVNQAAVALENASLYEKTEQQVRELSTMHTISKAFTSTLDYQEVVSVVAKRVGALFNAQYASVFMPDDSEHFLNIVASYKLSAEYVWTINKKRRMPIGVGPVGMAYAEGRPFTISDIETDGDYELWKNVASVQNYASLIALPLISKGQRIGVICIYFTQPREFSAGEVSLLTTIANEAAIAIENARIYENLQDAFVGTIRSLAETIDAKDSYTRGHSERVSLYAEAIARGLGINGPELQTIRYAGYLHDVGKIGIPDSILTKPGKLTGEEFAVIKKHPVLSERILRPVNFPFPVQAIVRHHHERYDGKGYPDALCQEEIPLGARILFVADAYEAMTSDRPYRKALSNRMALEELMRNRGTQFDSRVVEVFARIIGTEEEGGEELEQKAS